MSESDSAGPLRRNIILLSDGTGASSLSFNKSNVWRVFTTLDLGPNSAGEYEQIAFYDDGVGTSGFKPLTLLGGGFGWGLSRNVRQMYAFLCRHYQPGDKIYIFGFSRGAFTARVLAHFIAICGIVDRTKTAPAKPHLRMETERGLKRGVKQAYKSYRRSYWDRAWAFQQDLAKAFRAIRNKLPGWEVLSADEFSKQFSLPKPANGYLIEFVGVWDTVDAVGLPIDELADLLDKWLYPYKFPNQRFSKDVARACHALAVDDERQTFHPLIWDETDPADAQRVKQVWFAGMHSNVGGGYPEDNLAYISLDWMIGEVRATPTRDGLVFNQNKLQVIRQRAEPVGKMYDSRRGAAVYYRYKPRNVAELCRQQVKVSDGDMFVRRRITVDRPKIHHSVIDRIGDDKVGYAPVGLPGEFDVVDQGGGIAPFVESAADRNARMVLLERARDHISWRRLVYFCLLALTYAILTMPFYRPPNPDWQRSDGLRGALSRLLEWVFGYADAMIPDFADRWTNAWIQSPLLFVFFVAIFLALFEWNYWVIGNTQELGEGGWWTVKGNVGSKSIRPHGIFERLTNAVRVSPVGQALNEVFWHYIVPTVVVAISLYLVWLMMT